MSLVSRAGPTRSSVATTTERSLDRSAHPEHRHEREGEGDPAGAGHAEQRQCRTGDHGVPVPVAQVREPGVAACQSRRTRRGRRRVACTRCTPGCAWCWSGRCRQVGSRCRATRRCTRCSGPPTCRAGSRSHRTDRSARRRGHRAGCRRSGRSAPGRRQGRRSGRARARTTAGRSGAGRSWPAGASATVVLERRRARCGAHARTESCRILPPETGAAGRQYRVRRWPTLAEIRRAGWTRSVTGAAR